MKIRRSWLLVAAVVAGGVAGSAPCAPASGASTSASPGSPLTATGWAMDVTGTSATVIGGIDPNGSEATYAFEYGASALYATQSAVHTVRAEVTYKTVAETLTGLLPGTTYHFRLIAANSSGVGEGRDATFTTAGATISGERPPALTSGPAVQIGAHRAVLTGKVTASGSDVRYYFALGTRRPYELRTVPQTVRAGRTVAVWTALEGLMSNRTYHYRLVAEDARGGATAGADRTFTTLAHGRQNLRGLVFHVSNTIHRRLPVTVTVRGRLMPPKSLPRRAACKGFTDIAFRLRKTVVRLLRAGIRSNCTFTAKTRLSARDRVRGRRLRVSVVFSGNEVLHRSSEPARTILVG